MFIYLFHHARSSLKNFFILFYWRWRKKGGRMVYAVVWAFAMCYSLLGQMNESRIVVISRCSRDANSGISCKNIFLNIEKNLNGFENGGRCGMCGWSCGGEDWNQGNSIHSRGFNCSSSIKLDSNAEFLDFLKQNN